MLARAFWITAPGEGEIRTETLPARRGDEVVVKTLYSAISRGTESLVFRGRVPESQYQAMRAPHQGGEFPAPVKYGYSSVGRIIEGPASDLGRAVFALFPHQTCYLLPRDALVPLPPNVPPGRAVLAANGEAALNAVWDSGAKETARVSVIGGGTVGCLSAYLLKRLCGCRVELIDRNPERAEVAAAFGLAFALPREARGERDLILHASGNPEGLELALRLCAFEGEILELSWYGSTRVPLPLGEDFHAKRLTIRSSQVGAVAPAQRGGTSRKQRLAKALSLLDDPALDRLISGESAFDELPQVMARLSGDCPGTICHRIVYPD